MSESGVAESYTFYMSRSGVAARELSEGQKVTSKEHKVFMHHDHVKKPFSVIASNDDENQANTIQVAKIRLKEVAERLDENHAFAKGQFVKWKLA
jgi:hypothetical protein